MSFEQFVSTNEPLIRMGFFFGVFALVTLCELASPRRVLKLRPKQRWTAYLGIVRLLFLSRRNWHGRAERGERLVAAEQLRRAILASGAAGCGGDGFRGLAAARLPAH